MATAAADLRALADALERGEPPPPEVAARIAHGIRRHLADPVRWPLDLALGLRGPRGWPWWRREAIARRDEALRTLGRLLAPDAPLRRRAATVRAFLSRYETTRWRRHEPPRSRAEEVAAEALACAPVPGSLRRLEQILRNDAPGCGFARLRATGTRI